MLLGEAVKGMRHQAVIATKFGIVGQTHSASGVENVLDSRPESIRKQVDESLRNLQTDYIDLYYQHRIDPNVPAEAVAEVMGELIKAGKIRHWGVSNAPIEYMAPPTPLRPLPPRRTNIPWCSALPKKHCLLFAKPTISALWHTAHWGTAF